MRKIFKLLYPICDISSCNSGTANNYQTAPMLEAANELAEGDLAALGELAEGDPYPEWGGTEQQIAGRWGKPAKRPVLHGPRLSDKIPPGIARAQGQGWPATEISDLSAGGEHDALTGAMCLGSKSRIRQRTSHFFAIAASAMPRRAAARVFTALRAARLFISIWRCAQSAAWTAAAL